MKLLIKSGNSPKSMVKMKFYIFGKQYLSFASDRLFIFSVFIVLREKMQNSNLFWKIPNGTLKLPKKLFTEIFKQYWANVIGHMQLDIYWSGYFHKILVEHYCLGKNHKSRTLPIPAAKSQNFVNFTGAQNPHQTIFGTKYNIINMKLIMFLKNVN